MIKSYDLIQRWSKNTADCRTRVTCSFERKNFIFGFEVVESAACFRQVNHQDGTPCWEDSCVEVFLQSGRDKSQYFNFECNSAGAMLGELGSGRQNRRPFSPDDYARIARKAQILECADHVHWTLELVISSDFIGIYNENDLCGNLYKCASKADCVHYLSAFDIASKTPDFHRPEAFRPIFQSLTP